jgi:hypothetical protein
MPLRRGAVRARGQPQAHRNGLLDSTIDSLAGGSVGRGDASREKFQYNEQWFRPMFACRRGENEVLRDEGKFDSSCGHALTIPSGQLWRLRPSREASGGGIGLKTDDEHTMVCGGIRETMRLRRCWETNFTFDASAPSGKPSQGPFGGAGKCSRVGPANRESGGRGQ